MLWLRLVREKSKRVRQRASQVRKKSHELRSMGDSALQHRTSSLFVPSYKRVTRSRAVNHRLLEASVIANVVSALKIDLNVGLTMAAIASQTRDQAKRRRTQNNARVAYDSVARKARTLSLSEADEAHINTQLAALRFALESLGEAFS